MPQHDLVIDNASGAAVRADLNNALAALGSTMKGPNAPPAPLAGMMWLDDDTPSASIWTLKMYDGADWIEIGRLNVTTNIFTVAEGSFAPVDIASAATTDIGAAASPNVRITGTTGITSLGTVAAGTRRFVSFAGALTLTHNATSLILPGAANITTAAGDTATAVSLGSGNWVVTAFQRASALPALQGLITGSGLTMATGRLLGRVTAATGAIEELTAGTGLTLSAGDLSVSFPIRAWVNFNGTGTVSIRASGNVTSITDNGTGDYTVNLNFTMPDANYAPVITVSASGAGEFGGVNTTEAASIASITTTSFRFACKYSYSIFSAGATSGRFDPSIVSAIVVR